MALQEIINFVADLAEEERLRVCVKQSLLGGAIAGVAAAGLGILLGPVGLLLGGAGGGAIACLLAQGKYVSAVEIIRTMNPENRDRLARRVQNIMRNVNVTDVAALAGLVAGDVAIRNQLLDAMVEQFHAMHLNVEGR